MPTSIRPGDVLAGRYRLIDLLSESGGGRFWRAHDGVLERHVALHVIAADDPRSDALLEAARRSATVLDPHILRVLDAERTDALCFVVNEWGQGTSLDIMLATGGVLPPRRAAWVVAEVAAACEVAHERGVAHGRLNPENVLVDTGGAIRVIGWCVDAALHGRGTGTLEDDVADLAGLLHAALTGRWGGPSSSAVPSVPRDHGRVLRPRQVRAGIPRPLDSLCDQVLGGGHDGAPLTARAIHADLVEFVGDPTGIPESLVDRLVSRPETVVLSAVPEFAVRDPDATGESSPVIAPADIPTEMSLPAFSAADEADGAEGAADAAADPASVSTGELSASVAPPPTFEAPPERPLFAPEPPDGAPARRPRVQAQAAADPSDFWPWDTGAGPATGWGTDTGLPVTTEDVPGRNTFRLAAAILAFILLFVAVAVAFNLGRGRTPLGAIPGDDSSSSSSTSSRSPSADPQPIPGLTSTDLDPQSDDGEEYPELASAAVDGDPSTAWRTSTYLQQLGPGGLKTGVGLVIDLGESTEVREVDLTLVGQPTSVELYLSDDAPSRDRGIEGQEPVASVEAGVEEKVALDQAASGRYLTVWLTSLPEVDGGFRGEVAEVSVLR